MDDASIFSLHCVAVKFSSLLFVFMLAGDDDMPPRVLIETTVVSTPVRNIDVVISQDRVELPIQEHGLPVPSTSLVENLNSHSSSGPVTQGDLKQVCLVGLLTPLHGSLD